MNATDYKVCIRVLNQAACVYVAERVHVYRRVIFVRVTSISDACHTCLVLNGLYRSCPSARLYCTATTHKEFCLRLYRST